MAGEHDRDARTDPRWRRDHFDVVEEGNLRVILPKERSDWQDMQHSPSSTEPESTASGRDTREGRPLCNFFGSSRGCMRGDACWFRHVLPEDAPSDSVQHDPQQDRAPSPPDGELDVSATTSAAENGNRLSPSSSPPNGGSPRWADYSDWQGYDYYGTETSGIVGSMVLKPVSSSSSSEEEEEDGDENR